MLIGYNIVAVGASSFTTSVLIAVFGNEGVLYATLVMSVLVIVFAEVLPKTVAINKPDRVSLLIARPVAWTVALFGPVTLATELAGALDAAPVGVRIGPHQSVLSATEEIRGQVDLLHREGGVAKTERDMLGGLLDLRELDRRRRDGPPHPDAHHRRRPPPAGNRARGAVLALHPPAALARRAREHGRRAARQGPAAGARHRRRRRRRARIDAIALERWFVPDTTSLTRPVARVPGEARRTSPSSSTSTARCRAS